MRQGQMHGLAEWASQDLRGGPEGGARLLQHVGRRKRVETGKLAVEPLLAACLGLCLAEAAPGRKQRPGDAQARLRGWRRRGPGRQLQETTKSWMS